MSSRLMLVSACRNSSSAADRIWEHDFFHQLRVRFFFGLVDRSNGAKNIVCRYVTALARKLITAVRTADALEDAIAHERL